MMLHDLEDENEQNDTADMMQPNSSGDDSIHQIRYNIDEMFHQLSHLVRSQDELLDAIQENPEDADFAEAFWENNAVVKNKKTQIQQLLAKIWNRDPVYFRKVDKLLSDLLPDSPPPEPENTTATPADQGIEHLAVTNRNTSSSYEQEQVTSIPSSESNSESVVHDPLTTAQQDRVIEGEVASSGGMYL